ncbi:MAG TPA: ABC transporter substrate-binding protein [Acidocella sp.]|nr:ABC transporter substrate-binding protein [Acidocella sp.]
MSKPMQSLKIIAFPGAPNLPVYAAIEHGFFEAENIDLDFSTTSSSLQQMTKFATGECDIVFTAFDNIVAYREGQGAIKFDTVPDFEVILGATQIELSIVVAPDISSASGLKGKTLALDAISTGFAFVCYQALETLGLPYDAYTPVAVGATPERWLSLKEGKHAGTITIEPFTSIALAAGFRLLARSSDMFPAYQGGIIAVRHQWASANANPIESFIRVYLKSLNWVLDPANRAEATSLLLKYMPEVKPGVVNTVIESLLSPRSGLTPNGAVLRDGMKTVLDLRSRFGRPHTLFTDIDKYLNLSFYERVLRK